MSQSSASWRGAQDAPQIDRTLLSAADEGLATYGAAFLAGPYEVGKSDLAREIARRFGPKALMLDGSDARDRQRILGDEDILRRHDGGLVVIDQLQDCPGAADIVRQQLDKARLAGTAPGRFLVLGSQSTEAQMIVATRIGTQMLRLDLAPIGLSELQTPGLSSGDARTMTLDELASTETIARPNMAIDLETLWMRGGFPRSLFATDDAASFAWRGAYIDHLTSKGYRHISPLVSASTFRDLLGRLAAGQGESFEDRSRGGLQGCIDHLVDLGLVRQLQPWSVNVAKRYEKGAKVFLRDSGLLHTLLNRRSLPDLQQNGYQLGHSWEGFCIENLVTAAPRARPFYYRDADKNEIDLVLDYGEERRLAIEIKSPAAKMGDGFDAAARAIDPIGQYVVRRVEESYTDANGRRIMTLQDMIGIVRDTATSSIRQKGAPHSVS
ncbi:hypothetical protein SAMN05444678_105237 [Sphingomonas sp. YR710]|uniref:ATP-binding protein n=1 Tax=Sphingomonas sp. YR710 TaxID=1882773 RepID=UPI0008826C38|nr:DUF4143 domain-containing protein [Sphingomonas sp. YR710]SDC78719.1 hypothetical protein SAMN05444678_105237 [Sphingomonas sp. YR710]